ncbi:MAG: InlB B-repeat-containing protein [Clostridia bacterium]|nr:InlB B-repeat-containing protein [Clostridia bacterium]
MIKSRIKSAIAVALTVVLAVVPMFSVNAAAKNVEYSASSSYMSSSYYKALCEVELTGDQVTDICNIAKTQVGYHESGNNYTEYGRWYGKQSYWCNVFVSWCAYVAGVPSSVFPKLAGVGSAYSSTFPSVGADCFKFGTKPVEAGDLLFSCTCSGSYGCIDHVGLIVDVDDQYIYTVEGNMSDAVRAITYPASTGYSAHNHARINYIARPNYQDRSARVSDISRADAIKTTENSIYALFDMSLPYSEAESVCKLMGGHLVAITSEEEQEIVNEIIENGSYDKYYIGLSDEENGTYLWNSGEEYDYTNLTGSPKANFTAVILNADGTWQETVSDKRQTGFICEIQIDKMIPANTASFGGSRYEIYDSSLTYEQATAFAKAKGGKLAEIETNSENQLLSLLLKQSTQYYLGVSGTKREVTSTDYGNYQSKVKFNSGKENYAVMLNDGTARWSVAGIFETKTITGFIVEYDETEKCTVTYDANGGLSTPNEQMGECGTNIVISEAKPTLKGAKFLGWSQYKDAEDAQFKSGDRITLDENVTLYAIWSK